MKNMDFLKRLVVSLIFLLSFTPLLNAQSYGTAYSVDGDISEWDLGQDYFADMFRAGKTDKEVESYLYLHYDCSNAVMYALVLTKDGVPGEKKQDDAWITINSNSNKVVQGDSGNDGTAPDFEWYDIGYMGNTDYVRGYEASFPISEGSYSIMAHLNVYDDGESQTSKTDEGWLNLVVDCPTIPYYDVGIVKEASDETPQVGQDFNFVLTVTNYSDATAQNVIVNDLINSSHFTYIGYTTSQGTYNSVTGEWIVGDLTVGQNETLTITVQALLYDEQCNIATITGYQEIKMDENHQNNSDEACVNPPEEELDLVVTKLVNNATPPVNTVVTFTIQVYNSSSTLTATNIGIEDIIVSSFEYQSHIESTGTYNQGTSMWLIPSLGPLSTATLEIDVMVKACEGNTAKLKYLDQTDTNNANNEAYAYVCPPGPSERLDLAVTKTVDDPTPPVNSIVKFTVEVNHINGIGTATNIEIEDIILPSFIYQSHNESTGTYNQGTSIWSISSLAPGATATLEIYVEVLACGDNIATLKQLDQVDGNSSNNEGFTHVCPPGPSGGGDGGIESNGSMASKIATRNYFRMKNDISEKFNNKSELIPFRQIDVSSGMTVPASRMKSETSDLLSYIPESGPFETDAMIVTPSDLLEISNAQEVFSADYYRIDNKRLAAILAMTTKSGEVYNHTKLICDRLTGSNLDLVRIVNIQDHQFILGKLIGPTGNVDFTVSFVAYESAGEFVIDNKWHNEDYKIDNQSEIFNFQVWSVTPEMTIQLVDDVLNRLRDDKNLNFKNNTDPEVPQIFVRNGYYKNGSLFLNIFNEAGATQLTVAGNLARIENGNREDFRITIPLNPGNNNHQLVEVPTGYIFDAGFSVENDINPSSDALYFADGPWGTYTEPNAGRIDEFITTPFSGVQAQDEYVIERNASITGEVKTYVSLFRTLKVGDHPVDLSDFDQIEFQANGSGVLEVIINKESIDSWTDQFRKVFYLEPGVKTYTINYTELTSSMPAARFTGEDVVSVVFNSLGNGNIYTDFEINIIDMKFKNGSSDSAILGLNNLSVENYPNPFSGETTISFKLERAGTVQIILYDMLGQQLEVIADNYFNEGVNKLSFGSSGLKSGTYVYKLFNEQNVIMNRMSVLR